MATLEIEWIDGEATAVRPANPDFPDGEDVEEHPGASPTCFAKLPYPAPNIGVWQITCPDCSGFTSVTAAGLADDPRSFRMTCRGARK